MRHAHHQDFAEGLYLAQERLMCQLDLVLQVVLEARRDEGRYRPATEYERPDAIDRSLFFMGVLDNGISPLAGIPLALDLVFVQSLGITP